MKKKNTRIVSLVIAVLMVFSISGVALAIEDISAAEDVIANPIEIAEHIHVEECAEHNNVSDELTGIQSASMCLHRFTDWVYQGAPIIINQQTYCNMFPRPWWTRDCMNCGLREYDYDWSQGIYHNFVWTAYGTFCSLCGYQK